VPDSRSSACRPAEQWGAPAPGAGRLVAERVDGATAIVECLSSSPLRLFTPRPRGAAAWVIAASHGGGLVAGDFVDLSIELGAGATVLLGTQAETKVYRGGAPARQWTRARVADGALLALLPDPVSPYAGARLAQVQRIDLAPAGSVLLLDALTAGRVARGERWAFLDHQSRIEATVAGALVLADGLRLVSGEGPPLAERLAGFELLATAVLLGPRLAPFGSALLEAVGRAPAEGGAAVLSAASPLPGGGALLRVAARSVEAGMLAIRAHLRFAAELLGDDPFDRRP